MTTRPSRLRQTQVRPESADFAPNPQRPDRPILAPVILFVLVWIAFFPALGAGFVDWDDHKLIRDNPRVQALTLENLAWMFTTSYLGHFQPLTWLSLALDFALWRGNPKGLHITNIAFHAVAAILFYFLAKQILTLVFKAGDKEPTFRAGRSPRKSSEGARDHKETVAPVDLVWPAFAAAFFFACHPLRAESVAWLAERRDVVSGVFYLLGVLFYVRYAANENGQATGESRLLRLGRLVLYAAAWLSVAISLMAKAVAMTAPAVLLILDVYPLRRWDAAYTSRARMGFRLLAEKLPFLALGAAAAFRAWSAQTEAGHALSLEQHDWMARTAQACYGLMFYLWKTFLPTGLSPLYPLTSRDALFGPQLWISAALLAGLGLLLAAFRRRTPGLIAALLVYAVTLSPVLGFAQSGPQWVADRYSYLACLGVAVLVGWVWARFAAWASCEGTGRRIFSGYVAVLAVALLTIATWRQTALWKDALTLWGYAVRVSPESVFAHTNFGDALARNHRYEEAAQAYEKALALAPKDPVALHHMGDLHFVAGRKTEALKYYLRTLSVDGSRPGLHLLTGRLLEEKGHLKEAVRVMRDGANLHPHDLDLIESLAGILATSSNAEVRDGEDAVRWGRLVVAARGERHARSRLTLASALAEAGQFEEAVATARQALAIAEADGDQPMIAEAKRRLELFVQERPFHERERG